MIDEIALLAFRADWERRALGLILGAQREEQAEVRVRGRSGFTHHRWLAVFFTIWIGIAEGWGQQVEEMLATDEQKDARFFLAGSGLGVKSLHEEAATVEQITKIVTDKALSVVEVSEAEWIALGEGVWGEGRAATQAATETVQAQGWTQHQVAQQAPVLLLKIWQAILDSRTRDTHLDANGQVRRLDDPFDVGGDSLQWPADSRGSLAETINCRCWEDYELVQAPGSLLRP